MAIGFDASQDCSRVAAAAVSAGVDFVCRYFKNMSLAEARALSDAGLKIVSIFETTAKRALGGAPAGATDGARSLDYARQLGQPPGSAIYTTVDFGEVVAEDSLVIAYLAAFKHALTLEGIYKLGVYGEGAVCEFALDGRIADYVWLAGGMAMRGSREFLATGRAHIVQDVGDKAGLDLGISIDSDTSKDGDYGGWSLPAVVVEPIPAIDIPSVLQLQRALNIAGASLAEDGVWGIRSSAALAAYYHR